ncbi:TPA: Fe(3+)-hydroxamate ABC transporter substrate-binding protein FhuD [Yersinia enterocolitica]|uniref:Fe(3+)-hydroxamate ABC transporter substrate-binding protein FhuD n=1 Tax=Yersinia enterocolitica TaxID=630 RepID=UPI0029679AE5|nr:Fe(3+)-hydroxamate ABC transporter substrate-binding protein FhuD [Yersinia enterocolitica]HDS3334929.1 Fe(3+)-hydroxamate ABC transporter substrate-binding protein FhuD [Yersinia enterocolitica subsp. palearctica]HDL6861291.1 Fe(3+)-hydroxamate ABC transporter substrate-binding protein FhuD [Yersinia enterocolitica]HDL6864685.1 Fe(3+)-hydroxamate ABC transporter substrate-binding protein FhuD [Yersinia enterocolitica]HDL6868638.1 Fe(3+)-hydroxamate ABC transporter substrate-binding protein 
MKMHLPIKHIHLTPPDLTRRRLLTALALSPLLYSLSGWAVNPPKIDSQRVVALEWLPVELLLALGVTPYGVADTHNYRLWVEEPELPTSVIDVGQRTEPNLELLQQMAPSLILMSEGFGPSPEKLAPIAPSMSFAFSQQDSTPLVVGKNSLRALGERLGLEAAAEQHLNDFNQFMQAARQRFSASRNTSLLMFSLLDSRHALVIGQGSLFQDVLNELNIKNAWQGETNIWGSAVVGIERLATVKPGRAICFVHGNSEMLQQVTRTPLWQSMSFVRQNQLQILPAVWFYGATLSAMRFVRLLESAWGKSS